MDVPQLVLTWLERECVLKCPLWQIWHGRNEMVFRGVPFNHDRIVQYAYWVMRETLEASQCCVGQPHAYHHISVGWSFLPDGWVKANVDGSVR